MSDKEYDFLVFIGRFQPYHNGHHKVVKAAFEKSENLVIVLGGCDRPRTIKNPWSGKEREEIIRKNLTEEENKRTKFVYQKDYVYNDMKWLSTVREKIQTSVMTGPWQAGPYRLGIIGHKKDSSSYYLSMFPTWGSVSVENFDGIDATQIRNVIFSFQPEEIRSKVGNMFSEQTLSWITAWSFSHSEEYESLIREQEFIVKFKESWKNAPYTPTFNTVDSVVIQGGHILLVTRKKEPGKGLYAMPGGYLDPNEYLIDSAIRELKEETKIDVPIPVLKGSIKKQETFDYPWRSLRGRIITRVFLFELNNSKHIQLPNVKGSDDAASAEWVPIDKLTSENMFEDHFDIIQSMLGI